MPKTFPVQFQTSDRSTVIGILLVRPQDKTRAVTKSVGADLAYRRRRDEAKNSPNFASLHWMFVINIKYNGATARNYDLR